MKGSIEVTYKGLIFQVDYDYTPGRPGMWNLPNGDPGYPDDPAEMDIEAIRILGIDVYEVLSQESIDAIDQLAFDKVQNEQD
jgi:hypothetical protein